MVALRFCVSALAALACHAVALPSSPPPAIEGRATVPDKDPFYDPPAGFESKAPGTILKDRFIIPAFLGLIPDPVEAHQLLYRTTSINGSAIAAVTTVFKPLFHKRDRFVAFHTAYDAAATKCNPSYTYQLGANAIEEVVTSGELLILQAYLLSGYIVSSSDYEGPDAAFAAGRLEGKVALDGMRAVSNFKKLRLSTSKPAIVSIGYSGGSIASMWAAGLQPSYAPELNIKGWVGGGVPANFTGVIEHIDGTAFAGFIPTGIAGLIKPSAYQAETQELLERIVRPKGKEVLEFANSHCTVDMIAKFTFQSIFDPEFQSLGKDFLYDPTIGKVLDENLMGVHQEFTPTAPVLLYHATQDEVIPYDKTAQLQKDWCSNGADVELITFEAGGHLTTEIVGTPDVLKYTAKAFAGTLGKGCSNEKRYSNKIDPIAWGLNLEPIALALINLLGGRQD